MDVSIVSGTYNRLPYLQKMVLSVRQSVANLYGLQYEIVLVDGGSQDTTQAWCAQQPDIRLIEHGKLMGAVKAFNDGAYAAIGKYVIMANDDIEFVEDSIATAYLYMETHHLCGGGCFYQNRNGRDWHVESMPAVQITGHKKGNQIHVPYAQVGIFPKWLGDAVGWWCQEEEFGKYLTPEDYRQINDGLLGLHTYGGDNELSARIIDLGFTVDPIPGAKISDREADDDLRRTNNIEGGHDPKSVKGHHPDSWKWGKKWYRRNERIGFRNLAGPIVNRGVPLPVNPIPVNPKERILYLPLFEPAWQVQKEQKRGLRDALAKVGLVYEYDYMRQYAAGGGKKRIVEELLAIITRLKPTVFLSQLHNSDQLNAGDIRRLRQHAGPQCRFVNWNGDYWPEQLLDDKGLELAKAFDLMTVVNREVVDKHQAKGINTHYWQIGWEPDGRGHEPDTYHDIVFLASGYSSKRQRLGQYLSKLPYTVGIYGQGWPEGMAKGENLYNFKAACQVYRGAKIAIGDSQWPESGFVSNRIMQILAAGNCVLCHQWFRDYEQLGLIDGENCLIWQTTNDLEKILQRYLTGPGSRQLKEIARRGEELALASHSFEARVTELWQRLGIDQQIQDYASWRW